MLYDRFAALSDDLYATAEAAAVPRLAAGKVT